MLRKASAFGGRLGQDEPALTLVPGPSGMSLL
jgi:hypothetical protein